MHWSFCNLHFIPFQVKEEVAMRELVEQDAREKNEILKAENDKMRYDSVLSTLSGKRCFNTEILGILRKISDDWKFLSTDNFFGSVVIKIS